MNNNKNIISNPEDLKNYLEKSHKIVSFDTKKYLDFIKAHFEYYMANYNAEHALKNRDILNYLYNDTRYWVSIFTNRKKFDVSLKILQLIELYIPSMYSYKIINYETYLEYYCNLIFFLSILYEEKNALILCGLLAGELFMNFKDKRNEVCKDQEKRKKDVTDFNYCLEQLIKISKIGQLMAAKIGLHDVFGNFYYYEKYFTEKLLLGLYKPISYYTFLSPPEYILSSYKMNHVIITSDNNLKGIKKLKVNLKLLIKGVFLFLFRKIANYGEKPFKLLAYSILIILIFCVLYFSLFRSSFTSLFDSFYFSFLTFASFGFSDTYINNSLIAKILIMAEISLGIIFINGFIVLLARKLLR